MYLKNSVPGMEGFVDLSKAGVSARPQRGALIGLDWGTSSLRAYLMADDGALIAERMRPFGIMRLAGTDSAQSRKLAFQSALKQICGDWLVSAPEVPVIACGMVGSAQGWREVPYLSMPAQASTISAHLAPISTDSGRMVFVVPGLKQSTDPVNVMRGEETQLVGCMSMMPQECSGATVLIGLPGTHSKWVTLKDGSIQHCETFMTGEVFDVLCEYTILGRTMQRGEENELPAFDSGVLTAVRQAARGGVLSTIFTTRSLGLAGALSAKEQPAYLSGLLVGAELAGVMRIYGRAHDSTYSLPMRLFLAGGQKLCGLYQRALQLMGCEEASVVEDASPRGLWTIALQAGLVSPSFATKGAIC